MEEGVSSMPLRKSIALSLQIIITILTIIKLFINFHEFLDYSVILIIDIILNFTILIDANIIPFIKDNDYEEAIFIIFIGILGFCWTANLMTGIILSFYLGSNDLLGIYNFILYIRIILIFGFMAISSI